MASIGKEVRKLMIDNNVKTKDLAKKLNISRSTLYKKLQGDLEFTRKEINVIIAEFKLTDNEVIRIFFDQKVS